MAFKVLEGDEDKDGNPVFTEYPNQVVYEIDLWIDDNGITIYHKEAIEYALSVRKVIRDKLLYDNSIEDLARVKIIESIENHFIVPAINCWVEDEIIYEDEELRLTEEQTEPFIPKNLKGFKKFEYTPFKTEETEFNKLPKWGKELVKVLIKKGEIKHNDLVIELEKKGSFPQSYCGNLTKIFKTENAKEFLKKEISHSGYWKLNNPEKMKELSSN